MHANPTPMPFIEDEATDAAPARTNRRAKARPPSFMTRQLIDRFSHDVRTPMTVVNEYLSLLTDEFDGCDADERRQILDVICDRVDDLNRTFSNFVDALRLEARTFRVWPCRCAVADIVGPLEPVLRRKAAIRKGTVLFDLPSDLPDVFCDKEQIGRVIYNLAAHAINDHPSRAVEIWAAANGERNEVVVGVTDEEQSHPGPPSEHRPVASGKNLRRKLRLARQLARRNLAELESETTDDATSFWFGLPLPEPAEITLRFVQRRQRHPNRRLTVSIARLSCAQALDRVLERDLKSFCSMLLGPRDLILPVGGGGWLLLVCRKEPALAAFARRMHALRGKVNQKRLYEPLPELYLDPLATWSSSDRLAPVLETIKTAFVPDPALHS
jgi:hypothetical protein